MTKQSKICNFIARHIIDWEDQLTLLGIKTKRSGDYAIFNYEVMADFSNPLVQEARGIILDISDVSDPSVVCWPFRKFGKERAYEILSSDDFNFDSFIKSVPEHIADAVIYYKLELENAKLCVRQTVELARALKDSGSDRKSIAEFLKDNNYRYYGFKALDSDKTSDDILHDAGKKILSQVKEYEPEKEKELER